MNYFRYDDGNNNVGAFAETHESAVVRGRACWKGDELSGARIQRRRGRATALAWHPTLSVIACGWESGHVTVHEVLPRASALSVILPDGGTGVILAAIWTSRGSRLLAGFSVSPHTCAF